MIIAAERKENEGERGRGRSGGAVEVGGRGGVEERGGGALIRKRGGVEAVAGRQATGAGSRTKGCLLP